MQEKYLYQIMANLELSNEEALNQSKRYDYLNATFYYSKAKGGRLVMVSDDGSYLMAGSVTNIDKLIDEFKTGRRNGNFE